MFQDRFANNTASHTWKEASLQNIKSTSFAQKSSLLHKKTKIQFNAVQDEESIFNTAMNSRN